MNNIYGTVLHQVLLNDPSSLSLSIYDHHEASSRPDIQEYMKRVPSKSPIIKISLQADLGTTRLVTGITASVLNDKIINKYIRFLEIEGFSNEDNTWRKLVDSCEKYECNTSYLSQHERYFHLMRGLIGSFKIISYGVFRKIRISFVSCKESLQELLPKVQAHRKGVDSFPKSPDPNQFHFEVNRPIKSLNSLDNMQQYELDEIETLEWRNIIAKSLEWINVYGYDLSINPLASQVVPLLNISNLLRKANHFEDAAECEILLGLALINARRFLQAAEILRRVSDSFVAQVLPKDKGTHPSRKDMQSTMSILNHTSTLANIPAPLLRAAKIEIIISDAIVQHSMVTLKAEALQRAAEYSLGQKNIFSMKMGPNYDVYTVLLKIASPLSKLLTKCLEDKLEPLQIASLRIIEFLIDTLGTNMGPNLALILKQILMTYPDQNFSTLGSHRSIKTPDFSKNSTQNQGDNIKELELYDELDMDQKKPKDLDPFQNKWYNTSQDQSSQGVRSRSNHKALLDAYNHMLETFMNVLTNMAPHMLHMVFNELVIPYIFLPDLPSRLRNYFFRLAERIVNICAGDLPISVSFYTHLLSMLLKEKQGLSLTQKLWEMLKSKAITNMENRALNKLIDWLADTLSRLAENEITERTISQLQYTLDVVALICKREQPSNQGEGSNSPMLKYKPQNRNLYIKDPLNLGVLLKPLVIWLDTIVNSQNANIDIFKTTWTVLTELISCLPAPVEISISDIALPLLWKVHKYCETSTPTQNMLKSLVLILSAIKEANENVKTFLVEFIPVFVECIPHSTHDESFAVFDCLIRLAAPFLDEFTIQKCILALLDQYTMKGKAQKQSKESFIKFLVGQTGQLTQAEQNLFLSALRICLLENSEPFEDGELQTTLYNTINNTMGQLLAGGELRERRSNHMDSKLFSKRHDCFQDKLQFAYEMLLYAEQRNFQILYWLVANGQLQLALEKLACSGNSKVRLRAMELLKTVMELFISCKDLKLAQMKTDKDLKDSEHLGESALLGVSLIPEFEMQTEVEDGKDNEYSTVKLVFCRFALPILKLALDQYQDSKIQYYSLALLDKIFQVFIPNPKIQDELERFTSLRKSEDGKRIDINEIDSMSPYAQTSIPFKDETYIHYRLNWILKFLGSIQPLLESTCANIKTLSLAIISSWVKPDLTAYGSPYQKKLKSFLFTMLMNLLTHKESDMRYWGLMILGSLCGMNYDLSELETKATEHLGFFQKLSNIISLAIWEIVYDLQKDWNTPNKELATALIQLAAPKDSIYHFYRLKKEGYTLRYTNNPINSQNIVFDFANRFNLSNYSQFSTGRELKHNLLNEDSSSINFSHVLKTLNNTHQKYESPPSLKPSNFLNAARSNLPDFASSNIVDPGHQSSGFKSMEESFEEDELTSLFWLEYCPYEVIMEALSLFRVDLKFAENYWIEKLKQAPYKQYNALEGGDEVFDRFYLEADELESPNNGHKLSTHNDITPTFNKHHLDEDINLDDLGIIEVEDEDWIDNFDIKEVKPIKPSALRVPSKGKTRPESHKRTSANSPVLYTAHKRNRHHQEEETDSELNQANIRDFGNLKYMDPVNSPQDEAPSSNLLSEKAGLIRPHNLMHRPLTPPLQSKAVVKNMNEYEVEEPKKKEAVRYEEANENIEYDILPPNLDFEEEKLYAASSQKEAPASSPIATKIIHNEAGEYGVQPPETFIDKMEPPYEFPKNVTSKEGKKSSGKSVSEKITGALGNHKQFKAFITATRPEPKETTLKSNFEYDFRRHHANKSNLESSGDSLGGLSIDTKEKLLKGRMRYQSGDSEDHEQESSQFTQSEQSGTSRIREHLLSGEVIIDDLDGEGKLIISEPLEAELQKEVPREPHPSLETQDSSQGQKRFEFMVESSQGSNFGSDNNLELYHDEESEGRNSANYEKQHYMRRPRYEEEEEDKLEDYNELSEEDKEIYQRENFEELGHVKEEDEGDEEDQHIEDDASDEEHPMRQVLHEPNYRFEEEDETLFSDSHDGDTEDYRKGLQINTDLAMNEVREVGNVGRSQTVKNMRNDSGYFVDKSNNFPTLQKVHSVKNLRHAGGDHRSNYLRSSVGEGSYNLREAKSTIISSASQEELEKGYKERRKLRFTKGLSQLEKIMENRRTSPENRRSLERRKQGKSGNSGNFMSYFAGPTHLSASSQVHSKGASSELVKDLIKRATKMLKIDPKSLTKPLEKQEKEGSTGPSGERRTTSAEKVNSKYYNLPSSSTEKMYAQLKQAAKKGGKLEKRKAKGPGSKVPVVKKIKEEKTMDHRTFFPRKVAAPLKNNFVYGKDEADMIDENNNQTL